MMIFRLVQSTGYRDKPNQNDGYEKKQRYVENYCNVVERPPSADTDPTYATIEESKYHSSESLYKWKETYLDQATTNGSYNGVTSSVTDQTVPQEKSFIHTQSAWSQYSHGRHTQSIKIFPKINIFLLQDQRRSIPVIYGTLPTPC